MIEFGNKERLQEQMDLPVVAGMSAAQVDALEQTMND